MDGDEIMAKGVTGLRAAIQFQRAYDSALQQERMTKKQLRKLKDRLKYRNGGMIEQVGLHKFSEVALLGSLILLRLNLQDPAIKADALRLGKQAMAKQAARKKKAKGPPQVFIAFPDPPPASLCEQLRGMGLSFKSRRKEWRGPVDYDRMMRAVVAAGWDGYVLRSGYAPAPREGVAAGEDAVEAVAAPTPNDVAAKSNATGGYKAPLGFEVELEN